MTEPDGGGAALALAREHAWAWFALHAGQRQQCLYYFILATSALVAGFGTALAAGRHEAAVVISVAGAALALVFMAAATGIAALAFVERVERTRISRSASYSKAVNLFHGLAVAAWLVAAIMVGRRIWPRAAVVS